MTYAVMIVLMLFGGVVQAVVPGFQTTAGVKVPVLLILAVYYALTRQTAVAVVAAVIAGLVQDALGQVPLGYSSFCFLILVLTINRFKDVVFTESSITSAFFGALSGLFAGLIMALMLWDAADISSRLGWAAIRIGWSAGLAALCAPAVFAIAFWIDRTVGNIAPKKESVSEEGFRYA